MSKASEDNSKSTSLALAPTPSRAEVSRTTRARQETDPETGHIQPGAIRPILLTEARIRAAREAVREQMSVGGTAQELGIHSTILYRWMRLGKQYLEAIDRGEDPEPEHESCARFFLEIQKGRADLKKDLLGDVMEGVKNWQSRAWILERTWPDEFAQTQRNRHESADGGPLKIVMEVVPKRNGDA